MSRFSNRRVFVLLTMSAFLVLTWRVVRFVEVSQAGNLGIEENAGRTVVRIQPEVAAEGTELQVGDRVISIENLNGRPRKGQAVTYVVERDGETLRFELTAGPLPQTELLLTVVLGVMGLGFLVCGAAAFLKARSRASALFALYAIFAGLHWGGPLASSSQGLQMAIWLVYFLLSSMLAESLFLHFILIFPQPFKLAARKGTLVFLYTPVLLASAIAILIMLRPSFSSTLQSLFFLLKTVQTNLFPLLAIVGIVVRFARASTEERQTFGLTVVLWGNLVAVLPYLTAVLFESLDIPIPGGQGTLPFTLFFIFTPLSFAYAIIKSHKSLQTAKALYHRAT